ncbi:MAG TPA: hypothetical protein VFE32_14890 [Puia sp.]|nr:hypothetical protein [Puia sp.]
MGRRKVKDADRLTPKVFTRVNDRKYNELLSICERTAHKDMSKLLRDLLYNRTIRTITRDMTFDNIMEELAQLRTEIKLIGININQMTKLFNTFPELQRKDVYARLGFEQYLKIESKVDRLVELISELGRKWLG